MEMKMFDHNIEESNKLIVPSGRDKEKSWQETRRVVDAYLKRSLSHNACLSTGYLKPEGYHMLKKNGRLPCNNTLQVQSGLFQKSSSDYDQSTGGGEDLLFHSAPQSRLQPQMQRVRSNEPPTATVSTQPSNQITFSELHKNAAAYFDKVEATTAGIISGVRCSACFGDDQQHQSILPPEIVVTSDDKHSDAETASTASMDGEISDEDDDDENPFRRRASFHKAVSKKSVMNSDRRKKTPQKIIPNQEITQEISTEPVFQPAKLSKAHSHKSNHGVSTKVVPPVRSASDVASKKSAVSSSADNKKDQVATNNNNVSSVGFCEKIKRYINPSHSKKIQTTPSNKRRNRNKKQLEEGRENNNNNKVLDQLENSTKSSTTSNSSRKSGKFLRNLSFKQTNNNSTATTAASPEVKHLAAAGFPSSTTSLCTKTSHGLKEKRGSLPSHARLTIGNKNAAKQDERRHSEDLLINAENSKTAVVANEVSKTAKRPQHLAIHTKKSKSKLRKILMYLKRQRTTSTTSSTNSSVSLPSIPHAVDAEHAAAMVVGDVNQPGGGNIFPEITVTGDDMKTSKVNGGKGDSSDFQANRQSMSFSHGDLERLKYDEIAETLERISKSFNRHIYSISSTPCSRMNTPAWDLSLNDLNLSRSSSRLASSNTNIMHDSSKSLLQVPTNMMFATNHTSSRPATAGPSPTEQRARGLSTSSNRSLQRRHTHHATAGSFDYITASNRVEIPFHADHDNDDDDDDDDTIDGVGFEINVVSPEEEEDEATDRNANQLRRNNNNAAEASPRLLLNDPQLLDVNYNPTRSNSAATTPHSSSNNDDISGASRAPPSGGGSGVDSADVPSTSTGITTSQPSSFDEDKLVELLVQALINRGDHYERSVNLQTGLEPMTRRYVADYLGTVTYHRFHNIAGRFVSNFTQILSDSATRHPEVLPVVLALDMVQVMYDIANTDSTRQNVGHILDLSYRYVNQFVQSLGNSWQTIQGYLYETQQDLERGSGGNNAATSNDVSSLPTYDEEVD